MSFSSYFWPVDVENSGEQLDHKDGNAENDHNKENNSDLDFLGIWLPSGVVNSDIENEIITNTYSELFEEYDYDIEQEIQENDELYNNVEQIYYRDSVFLDSIKEHKKYYIGYTVIKPNITNTVDSYEFLLNSCISPSVFFDYSIWSVKTYLYEFSIIYNNNYLLNNRIEIMQLYVNDDNDTYNVVLKTVWLRIFQRKWKKWNVERKAVLKHRMKLSSLRYFEQNGRWPVCF
jgi:hypothetical protein